MHACASNDREQVRFRWLCARLSICPGWCLLLLSLVSKEIGMKKLFLIIALLAATAMFAQQTGQSSTQQPGAQTQPGQPKTTTPSQQQPGMQQQQPGTQQPGTQQQQQPGMQQQQPGAQQ